MASIQFCCVCTTCTLFNIWQLKNIYEIQKKSLQIEDIFGIQINIIWAIEKTVFLKLDF